MRRFRLCCQVESLAAERGHAAFLVEVPRNPGAIVNKQTSHIKELQTGNTAGVVYWRLDQWAYREGLM